MRSLPSEEPTDAISPPKLWHPSEFGVFQRQFSAHEQHQLLNDDAEAQTYVSAILATLIAMGTVLAIISVSIIAFA